MFSSFREKSKEKYVLHKMISGPQLRKPISIIIIELTVLPIEAVAKKSIRAKALKSVSTVEPNNDLSLKTLNDTKKIDKIKKCIFCLALITILTFSTHNQLMQSQRFLRFRTWSKTYQRLFLNNLAI